MLAVCLLASAHRRCNSAVNDTSMFEALLDDVPPVRAQRARQSGAGLRNRATVIAEAGGPFS
jgi:hypothetical protein